MIVSSFVAVCSIVISSFPNYFALFWEMQCFGYNRILIFEVGFYFWNVLNGNRINNLQDISLIILILACVCVLHNMHTQDISVHLFRWTEDILITYVS